MSTVKFTKFQSIIFFEEFGHAESLVLYVYFIINALYNDLKVYYLL